MKLVLGTLVLGTQCHTICFDQAALMLDPEWSYNLPCQSYVYLHGPQHVVEDCRYRVHVAKVAKKTSIVLTIACVVGLRCAACVNNFL